MRGAVLKEYGEPLEIEERETPSPGPEEALVKMEAAGICRSDWHAWQGDYSWMEGGAVSKGNILGHEPAGTVVEVGEDVEEFSEGTDVVVPFNNVCGKCDNCKSGNSHMCENIRHYGFDDETQPGAFSTHLVVPRADFNLVEMPEGVSHKEMAGLGCRFVTSYHAMADRAEIDAGDWVVVYGAGGIGLSAVNVANALGANVIAVDIKEDKLSLAEELGAVETVNADKVEDVPAEIQSLTDGGAEISVDGLGIKETMLNSINSVDTLGKHIQLGITTSEEEGKVDIPIDEMLHAEVDIVTAKGMQPHRYDEIFKLMEHDKINPEGLITNEVELEDINDRLEAMTEFDTEGVEVITDF